MEPSGATSITKMPTEASGRPHCSRGPPPGAASGPLLAVARRGLGGPSCGQPLRAAPAHPRSAPLARLGGAGVVISGTGGGVDLLGGLGRRFGAVGLEHDAAIAACTATEAV